MDKRRELQRLGIRLQGALLARGYFHLAAGGLSRQIQFKRVYTDENKPFGFFEVDITNLPAGIQLETLSEPDTERYLSITLGHPVRAINGQGVTYCIKL